MDQLSPALVNGVGVVGLLVTSFWMLTTGRLCTGRELREKNDRIAALEAMVATRDKQLSLVLGETLPTVSSVLGALRGAAFEKESDQ